MARMKELAIDYEHSLYKLDLIHDAIQTDVDLDSQKKEEYLSHLAEIKALLAECNSISNISAPSIISRFFDDIISQINQGKQISKLSRLSFSLSLCRVQLGIQLMSKQTVLNSKEFYEDEISELKNNINKLESEIDNLGHQNTRNKALLNEKETLLEQQNAKLLTLEREKEELKRIEDARQDWSKKIKTAFSTLQTGLKPINSEKQRLDILYWAYSVCSVLLLIFLIVVEVVITCKLGNYEGIPTFKEYISLIVPIPVALALLFVFISQINRAQRQLVVIAKYIHDIEYTEEIMQAINSISVDMDDSMKRINTSMDKLLARHLACNLNYLDESSLKEQEDIDKEFIPTKQVLDILKAVIEKNK